MDYQFSFVAVYGVIYLMCAMFCVVLLFRTSGNVGRDLEVRFFRLMLWSCVVYCVVETVWAVGNFGYSPFINRFTIPLSVVNHFMVMTMCFFWFGLVEAHLHSGLVDRKTPRLLVAIPLLVGMALTASSPWTGWVFYEGANGVVERGPLYLLVLVITYGYPAVATIRLLIAGLRASTSALRFELFNMASFAIPPAVVGLVDSVVPMLPIVAPAFFLSFLIIFTALQDAQISSDALTGLNNRRRADRYFEESIPLATASNPFCYFAIDGDNFKSINDTYGHLEGDAALCTIAEALRETCSDRNVLAARWGGDEFVVMGFSDDVGDPEALVRRVHQCLDEERKQRSLGYPLGVTIGYAVCADPSRPKRLIVEEADRMLYKRKASRSQT